MKPLRIDFTPASVSREWLRTVRMARLAGGISIMLLAAGLLEMSALQQRLAEYQAQLQQLQNAQATAPRTTRARTESIPAAQALAVNAAIAQLNLPWRDLLDALEAATPSSIALLALEPDARKRAIRGEAEAKSSDAMIAYIERLRKQRFFRNAVLTRHEVNEKEPGKPLRFRFEIEWAEGVR